MESFNGRFVGHMPWVMTQNQRGPTCGLTAINVAYRILTGWTLFATKGQYRDFSAQQYNKVVLKGNENIYVLRRAAKDLGYTAAGEIVNADDLADLANQCEGVSAEVKETSSSGGEGFVEALREDIKAGGVPLVLFYVIPGRPKHEPSRRGPFQHWVPIFAIEDLFKWVDPGMQCINGNLPLSVKPSERAAKDAIMMWSWGKSWVTDGAQFGDASALSLDWVSGKPRKWIKHLSEENMGKLKWDETLPSSSKYSTVADPNTKVRETQRMPSRDLKLRGYINLTRT